MVSGKKKKAKNAVCAPWFRLVIKRLKAEVKLLKEEISFLKQVQ